MWSELTGVLKTLAKRKATCDSKRKLKHQKCHESIEFIGNNHKRSFVKEPGHFAKLKKICPDRICNPEKEDMSGKTQTYGNPNIIPVIDI